MHVLGRRRGARTFSAPIMAETVSAKYLPGLIESSFTWPKASRCTSFPSASILATMSLTPAPSEMKMLTESLVSRMARSRSASFSRSIESSGT